MRTVQEGDTQVDGDDRIPVFDPGGEVETDQSQPQGVGNRGTDERKSIRYRVLQGREATFSKYSGKAKVRYISYHLFQEA